MPKMKKKMRKGKKISARLTKLAEKIIQKEMANGLNESDAINKTIELYPELKSISKKLSKLIQLLKQRS